MRLIVAAAASLLLGAACVWAAERFMTGLTRQELVAHIVLPNEPHPRGAAIRLVNAGSRDIVLDTGGMAPCLVPVSAGGYALHFAPDIARPAAVDRHGQPATTVLRPGETYTVKGLEPLLRRLPPGKTTLTAIHCPQPGVSGGGPIWRGFVRSLPVSVTIP